MNNKNKKGSGNTTLTDRINALPFSNKVSEIDTSSCKCSRDESRVECLQRVNKACCRKIDIHTCTFDRNYPIFIYVGGLGCDLLNKQAQEESTDMYLDLLNTYSNISIKTLISQRKDKKKELYQRFKTDENFFPDKNFLFVCHKMKVALQTIKNISLSECKNPLFLKSNFLQDFSLFLQEKLSQNYTIYLYGESFGGAICNVISERVYGEKLFIRTFASIYISNRSLIPENIINYMFHGDVAWKKLSGKCQGAEDNIKKVDTVIGTNNKILADSWDESKESNTYESYYNFLGSRDEWNLHVGYYNYIKNNIKNDMQIFFENLLQTEEKKRSLMESAARKIQNSFRRYQQEKSLSKPLIVSPLGSGRFTSIMYKRNLRKKSHRSKIKKSCTIKHKDNCVFKKYISSKSCIKKTKRNKKKKSLKKKNLV